MLYPYFRFLLYSEISVRGPEENFNRTFPYSTVNRAQIVAEIDF